MWFLPDSDAALYREFRADLREHHMQHAVRVAAVVVFTLNMAFVALDGYAYPEKFSNFLIARMLLNVVLGVLCFRTSRTHPVASQSALCLATGGLLLWVIYGAGAPTGDYYVGLVLALVGLPVLLPLDHREVAAMWTLLVAGFLVSPVFVDDPFVWKTYATHSLFLVSGAFTGVASSVYLNGVRLRDFAQRREIEAARDHLKEIDRIKARFTANVHHELRTPLTLTLAPLEAILAGEFGEVPAYMAGYLKTMRANGLRLLKLVNDLLDLAKLEGEKLAIHRGPVELADVVGGIVGGARPMAERNGVELTTAFAPDLPVVYVDAAALEKIVVNLLGNALKFTDSGGRVEVKLAPHPEGITLVVTDTGIGIAPEQMECIFDRFAQVDNSATRKYDGAGIGLSLVKELVELHGGRVWAESTGVGRGARMHVVLPPGRPDDPHVEIASAEASEPARSFRDAFDGMGLDANRSGSDAGDGRPEGEARTAPRQEELREGDGDPGTEPAQTAPRDAPTIVVAEDNPEMRRLFADLLGREYRVRAVRNGREALEAARANPPDLVLTDVMMPEMSGTELCRALKADPRTQGIPVVLVTSKAEREMKIEGLELGADDYVTKPFHPRELMARVRGLVRLRSLQAELAVRNRRLEAALAEIQAAEVQLVQSERLAAVGELAAGVAHEANNPVNFALNAARNLTTMVKDVRQLVGRLTELDFLDSEQLAAQMEKLYQLQVELNTEEVADDLDELVAIVIEGLERTERLVGNLRDFASPQSRPDLPIDVRRGLHSTIQLLEPTFRQLGIDVDVRLAEKPLIVSGQGGALNQVFLNLLKNAADAIETSRGTIGVTAREEGATVVVEVQDDGPGLPEAIQDRLFEPFVTTKSAGRGSGLGLSISRRIVSEHGGTIQLLPREPHGTLARVRLPIATR